MVQKETRKYIEQDETKEYCLKENQMDLVEKYLDGLVEREGAIQPIEDIPLYYIFPSVHGGGLLVDLDYEEGRLAIAGDSSSLGRMVSHIEDARLGRLRARRFSKGEGVQSQ